MDDAPDPADATGPSEWTPPGQVGVGPWPGGPPAWPTGERYDPELLADGDARNVVDAYRYWRREAVAADLAARAHPFHVAIENFGHDHNIGTVVRTANAFGAAGVHIVGRRRWNRRGAMVTDRYLAVHHHDDVAALADLRATTHGLTVVAVDNTPGAQRLETADLPRDCLLLFGQEGPGVTPDARAVAALTVSIAQFGSTRSINAGVAAGHRDARLGAPARRSGRRLVALPSEERLSRTGRTPDPARRSRPAPRRAPPAAPGSPAPRPGGRGRWRRTATRRTAGDPAGGPAPAGG